MKIPFFSPLFFNIHTYAPGVLLCGALMGVAWALQVAEVHLFGKAWLETLVLAILVGAVVRTFWHPSPFWHKGIHVCSKWMLEIAIVLLGASLSFATILAIGPLLLVAIMGVVMLAIVISYSLGRLMGLSSRMAVLIACGNSICGNSAIAAVAPVIGAHADDVATSIAFTAVLGVATVLLLPLLVPLAGLSFTQFGIVAGLTVYAVPQVLAATAPVSAISLHMGALVKLVRVLMLGPVMFVMSLLFQPEPTASPSEHRKKPSFRHLVPWFMGGFLAMAGARSMGLLPDPLLPPLATLTTLLTTLSMAALGLGVDVHKVRKAGPRVIATVTLSLVALALLSLGVVFIIF